MSGVADDRWLGAWRGKPDVQEAASRDVARLGWLYVSRLVRERRPEDLVDLLARMNNGDVSYLRALRFLSSPDAASLIASAAFLLRRLPQSTRQAKTLAREVRGRVDWAATVQERLSRGGDPTVFVVSRSDRHADVPENRVLAYVLKRMSEAGHALGTAHPNIAERGLAAERFLSSAVLAGVRASPQISGMDRQALRMSRIPEFREQVAAVLSLHDSLFADDLDGLRAALGERIWLPPEADKLFELWCMFTIVQSLEQKGWKIVDLRLIGTGRGNAPTFVLRSGGREIRISYQGLPTPMLLGSRYRRILDAYDIDGSARRPDILLSAPGQGRVLYLLVEAKLTEDRDYVVDSIYKVLGYLADFEESLKESPIPRGVLVVWAGVGGSVPPDADHPIAVLDHAALGAGAIVPFVDALATAAQAPLSATAA